MLGSPVQLWLCPPRSAHSAHSAPLLRGAGRAGGYTPPTSMRSRFRLGACAAIALAGTFGARAEDQPATALAWKHGLSDMAQFERRRIIVKGTEESANAPDVATVMGHDLREGGLYLPVSAARDDLPA